MKNIFVGNLDFAATESSIRTLFESYGNVDRVNLVTDRDTGRSTLTSHASCASERYPPRRAAIGTQAASSDSCNDCKG